MSSRPESKETVKPAAIATSRWSPASLFNGTRLVQRLGVSFAAPLVLMLIAASVTGLQLKRIDSANAQMERDRARMTVVSDWISGVRGNLDRAVLATRLDAAIADDETIRSRLAPPIGKLNEAMAGEANAAAAANKKMNDTADPGDDDIRALVAEVGKHRARFITVRAQIRDDLLLGEGGPRIDAELLPLAKGMETALDGLQALISKRSSAAAAALAADVRHAQWVLLASCLMAVAIGALLAWRIALGLSRSIAEAAAMARAIAAGDLSGRLEVRGRDEIAGLQTALVSMQTSLARVVGQVRSSADSIRVASAEVASGNTDLSHRTELAATNLQQTASSMALLTGTVRQSSESAGQANQLASSASTVARRGGDVVSQVVVTMEQINTSSRKIADIISTIDGIAFQTNILALNAAVEAARAGEQGRGFAVVASEVRSLAQRSAEAAKEIKTLIGASVERVESGSRLVADAGSTMTEIVASVQRVSDIIGEISAAAGEQSNGIGAINSAVNSLDQMTQQNAALVEESAAAAESLKDQAARLAEVVSHFKINGDSSQILGAAPRPAAAKTPSPAQTAKAVVDQVKRQAFKTPAPAAAKKASANGANGAKPAPRPSSSSPTSASASARKEVSGAGGNDSDWESF